MVKKRVFLTLLEMVIVLGLIILVSSVVVYSVVQGLQTQNFHRGVEHIGEKIQTAKDLARIHRIDNYLLLTTSDKGTIVEIVTNYDLPLALKQKTEIRGVFLYPYQKKRRLEFIGRIDENPLSFSSHPGDNSNIIFVKP
jgi:hypothetical protein